MPLFGTVNSTPLAKRTYVSSSYATGSSGRLITLNLSGSEIGYENVSFDATTSLMFELGQSLLSGTNATTLDPLGTITWQFHNSSSSVQLLNGYESRIDVTSFTNRYRVYFTGSNDRETFGYHLMAQTAHSATGSSEGLADYIIAQWSAESVALTSTSIDTLIDEQTGGYDLTATGTTRATYQATSGPGGGPAIFFDGTNDRYRLDGITRNQPHAIVITAEFLDSDDIAMDSYNSQIYHLAFSWNLNIYAGGGGSLSDSDQSYGSGYHTWVFYFNGNSSTIKRDNVLRATGGSNHPGSSNGVGISLGGAYDGASYYSMRIARLTLVDATDTNDVQAVSDQHATDFGTYTP